MNISILSGATTKFGELWTQSPRELANEAVDLVIEKSGIKKQQIDALYIGNMLGGLLGNQENLGAMYADELGIFPKPSFRLEGACASGGLALNSAVTALKAGVFKTVLVMGIEKMTDAGGDLVASSLMAAGSDEERQAGLTFPGLYALMAQAYMQKYGIKSEDLALVSVKNHYHASFNSNAQFKFRITIKDVLNSAMIADPLRLLDCSPVTDGAAAVLLTTDEKLINKKGVSIVSSQVGTDSLSLHRRDTLTSLTSVVDASNRAYKEAGVKPKDINVAEVHDCFSIAEIIALEDLGFSKQGKGSRDLAEDKFTRGKSNQVINPSGGLKACGHPVGATGVKQAVEIYEQLMGIAGDKQSIDKAKYGLSHNVGGSGAVATIHIFRRM